PLLSKQIEVDSLRIAEPTVELIKNNAGKWNFSTLGQGSKQESSGGGGGGFQLSELLLDDGKIGLTDHEARTPRAQYDNIDIALRGFAPAKPFQLEATVRLPEKLEAKAAVGAQYDQAAGKLAISSLTARLGGMALSGSGTVVTNSTPAQLDLQIKVENASITE